MSAEIVELIFETHIEAGFLHCPSCGFEIPDSIVVCWKCGKRLK